MQRRYLAAVAVDDEPLDMTDDKIKRHPDALRFKRDEFLRHIDVLADGFAHIVNVMMMRWVALKALIRRAPPNRRPHARFRP
jgi:hypothetical protein